MTGFDPQRLRALFAKELIQIRRDPSTFLIAFLMPLIQLFLFGFAISLDNTNTRIGLVVLDDSAAALSLAAAFQESRYFDTRTARSFDAVRDAMIDGRVRGIVVIPDGFGRGVKTGHVPDIQVIADGAQPNVASFVGAYAEGVRQQWIAETQARGGPLPRPPIALSPRYWFNPGLQSRFMFVPGSIAIVMTMIGTLLTALVVAREWERGTMEAIMATPMRMAEFIASKIVPYFALALASMTLCTLLAVTLFGVPFRGSVLGLVAVTAAFLMPALGMGLFISSATKNQFVASQAALMAGFLPGFLLSGFLFEIASMPKPIQAITWLVPARYFIPCLQTVFLVGDVWALFVPSIFIMLGFGAFFFVLSFRVTRRRVG